MMHTLLALGALLASGAVAAQTSDTRADYSHALALTVSPAQAVAQLRLPRDVYLHAQTPDLRDLRVFDAQGARLPFALQDSVPRAQQARRDVPVRLFALQAARATGALAGAELDAELEVRRSPDGSVLSVSTRTAPRASADGGIDTLVLDLGPGATAVDALRFTLPAGTSNYQARVVLEVSDDLKQWDTVGDSQIAWLVNERTETLASDRMQFEARAFRYARLTWREGKPLKFAAVTAEAPLDNTLAPQLDRLLVQPTPGRFPTDFVYPAALALPVQRLGLELGAQNVVLPAQIGHYVELPDRHGGKKTSWQFVPVAAATFYSLNQGGQRRASGDIAITPAHAAQWVLRTDAAGGPPPALRLAWSPATLVFLANGKPPYRLAFGRADAVDGARALSQVAPGFTPAEILALASATAGPLETPAGAALAGPGAAERAAGTARTRLFALWAALLAGVGVLGWMAWKLLRQMK